MQLSTVSEVGRLPDASRLITLEAVEAMKWCGFVLMLLEHGSAFVFGVMPHWVMALGRIVFPLFAVALAVQWVAVPEDRRLMIVFRILVTGVAAAVVVPMARDVIALNVLFTLAAGLGVSAMVNSGRAGRYLCVAVVLLVSFAFEYGPLGVLAVYFYCEFALVQRSRRGWGCLLAGTLLICAVNGNLYALAGPLVAFSIAMSGLVVPRVRRLFHVGYVAQWPVFWALRAVV